MQIECSLGKAEWMCERCCRDCEHSSVRKMADMPASYQNCVTVKPADNVQVYADGKRAKVIPVTLRIARIEAIIEGDER